MYLFDKERTGQLPYPIGNKLTPNIIWDIQLPQYPKSGPESSAAIDQDGNVYFGCHNGCIYSITSKGQIRWQFVTKGKVYSSPLLFGGKVFFCCNGLDVICLSTSGKLLWSFQGLKILKRVPRWKKALNHIHSYFLYDYHSKSLNPEKITAWGSPNLIEGFALLVNLYGAGVVALNPDDGDLLWQTNLGLPWNHLAGVAVFSENDRNYVVATSQSNGLYVLNAGDGEVVWKRKLRVLANTWSNPSVDTQDKSIYCCTSRKNNYAWIYKFDYQGNLTWKRRLLGGVRGAVCISKSDFLLVPSLRGLIYKVHKQSGAIIDAFPVGDKNRGLWTSLSIDNNHQVLVNVKKDYNNGVLMKLDAQGCKIIWEMETGKALCVPVIDKEGAVYIGTWNNNYLKIES